MCVWGEGVKKLCFCIKKNEKKVKNKFCYVKTFENEGITPPLIGQKRLKTAKNGQNWRFAGEKMVLCNRYIFFCVIKKKLKNKTKITSDFSKFVEKKTFFFENFLSLEHYVPPLGGGGGGGKQNKNEQNCVFV